MLELDPPLMAASSQSSGKYCAKSAAIDSGDIALATPLGKDNKIALSVIILFLQLQKLP
jgi:hypothetical protein